MNTQELIQACIQQLKSKRSPNTVRAYKDGLNVFAEYLQDKELDAQAFIDYPNWVIEKYENKRSAQNRIAAANYFRSWLNAKGYLEWTPRDVDNFNFTKKDSLGEREFHKPKVAPERIVQESLEVVKSLNVSYPIETTRNLAILHLMHSSGIRISEVAALNVKDIDLNEEKVYVRKGKGKKTFFSPISPEAVAAIRKYWQERRWPDDDSLPAFGRHDKQSSKKQLRYGSGGIYNMIVRVSKEMNLPGGILTPHKYRHSVGTRWTKEYGIHAAQKMLHHENIDTTKGYVDIDDDYIMELSKQMYAPKET